MCRYGRIDPAAAREVFIREALVPGALATRAAFLEHNRRLVAEVAALEHKARRQDVLVDDAAIARFYDERLPEDIHSLVAFDRWREEAERADPRVLHLTREFLMRHAALHVTEALYPESVAMAGTTLPLKYRFAPGHPEDGLTLTVPLALLNQVDAARLTWLVPGMIREKVTHLLKALPKSLRARLMPLPETVTTFLEAVPPDAAPLAEALRGWLATRLRDTVPADVWEGTDLPLHLAVNVRVVDADRPRARERARSRRAARTAGRCRAALVRAGGTGHRAPRPPAVGLRRPAGVAHARARRAADHRLSGARRRRRLGVDRAARHAGRGRRVDPRAVSSG